LMFTRMLALRGMSVLATDLLQTRLQLASQFGAKRVFQVRPQSPVESGQAARSVAEIAARLTRGRGLDAALIAVPSLEVVREAQQLIRGAGQVLLFSHTKRGEDASLDLATICVDEKDLIGSYSADFTLQNEVAKLIFSRRLDVRKLVTHKFPLDQTAAAVELAAHPTPDSLKVVITQEDGLDS